MATRTKTLKKGRKFVDNMRKSKDQVFKGYSTDIIIPVMGPTGVGKSTFINSLLDPGQAKVEVGHGLESCTSHLVPIVIPLQAGQICFTNPIIKANGKKVARLILVDTPGFDDTYVDDIEILRRISVWLADSYTNDMKLGGVIYLHDITQTRMLGTTRRNLDMFRKLVGQETLKYVVLGTTKWSLLSNHQVGVDRQLQLETAFWKDMIEAGSHVIPIDGEGVPRHMVNGILKRVGDIKSEISNLVIQEELVNMRKYIPETEAGRTLKYTLDELIELQKRKNDERGRELLAKLEAMAKELKVPFSARIKRFFS